MHFILKKTSLAHLPHSLQALGRFQIHINAFLASVQTLLDDVASLNFDL